MKNMLMNNYQQIKYTMIKNKTENNDNFFEDYIKWNNLWIKFKKSNKIQAKYLTEENKNAFFYMLKMKLDPEKEFLIKIKNLEEHE